MAPGAPNVSLHGTPGVYPVSEGRELKVGRDPGICDICLTEPRVSGLHANVKLENGQVYVKDEGSNNGTYVNGGKIPSHVWQTVPAGAEVRFGPVEFTVRFE
jgi:pSer/pThr/pTyr-binding forkhead associated (FHA) protein